MIKCESFLKAAEIDIIGTVDGMCNAVDVVGNCQKLNVNITGLRKKTLNLYLPKYF